MQVHYYRSGIEERDRTKVGLYFCKDETPTELELGLAINDRFRIPAGEKRHRLVAKGVSIEISMPSMFTLICTCSEKR